MNQQLSSTEIAALELLGHYGYEGGIRPGGFTTALIGTFEKADGDNTARLKLAFPAMAYAASTMKTEGDEGLRRIIAGSDYMKEEA